MKKATKRLTSTYFMNRYRRFLVPDGLVHLKTDSNFMFTYTKYMIEANHFPVEFMTDDLYHSGMDDDIRQHPHVLRTAVAGPRTEHQVHPVPFAAGW